MKQGFMNLGVMIVLNFVLTAFALVISLYALKMASDLPTILIQGDKAPPIEETAEATEPEMTATPSATATPEISVPTITVEPVVIPEVVE